MEHLITYCEAFESALKDKERLSKLDIPHAYPTSSINSSSLETQFDLTNDELVAAVSLYKKKKKPRYTKDDSKNTRYSQDDSSCGNCGFVAYCDGAPCPASGKTCVLCKKKGHFANVCRSAIKTVSASAIVIATICHVSNVNRPLPRIDISINNHQ